MSRSGRLLWQHLKQRREENNMNERIEIPINPPKELLMSMALRYDHSLGIPGFYNEGLMFGNIGVIKHEDKVKAALSLMEQIYEEVVGRGFYKPELEEKYSEMIK